jgi:hypothetical protein
MEISVWLIEAVVTREESIPSFKPTPLRGAA